MAGLAALLAPLTLLAALAGCATVDNATFVTKTSISVVDADAAPASASIGFDRIEAYVGPRLADGSVYPVVAAVQSTGSGMGRAVQQSFAGGDAALLVIRDSGDKKPPPKPADGSSSSSSGGGDSAGTKGGADPTSPLCGDARRPPLVFGTTTNVGLKLGFADGTLIPSSFNFGYRRKEAAIVPVTEHCKPSVLSYAQNEATVTASADGATRSRAGLGVTQYFATGKAADKLAVDPDVQLGFKERAEAALGAVAAFEARERMQGRLTVDVFECLESLDTARLRQVIDHGAAMQLYDNDPANNKAEGARIRGDGNATDAQRRKAYMGALSLQLGQRGAADARTTNLRAHREVVCALAARQP
jgi:hypothetical protein